MSAAEKTGAPSMTLSLSERRVFLVGSALPSAMNAYGIVVPVFLAARLNLDYSITGVAVVALTMGLLMEYVRRYGVWTKRLERRRNAFRIVRGLLWSLLPLTASSVVASIAAVTSGCFGQRCRLGDFPNALALMAVVGAVVAVLSMPVTIKAAVAPWLRNE